MRLRISKKLLIQMLLMILTVCSTLVIILLLTQQLKINICNSFEKFLTRYERKAWNLTLKSVNLVKSCINYMGHTISSEWLFPEPEKVNSILHMKPPSNTSEVRSFLSLVTSCSKFVPNFTAITEPLRRLTRQKAEFIWTGKQESAFSKIKTFISKAPVLSYFHPAFETKIGFKGLGASKKTPANSFFQPVPFASGHYATQRPDIPKLKEKR